MIWSLSGGRELDFGARVQIFGVLNVTPDSFYDGGRYPSPAAAAETALEMIDAGADVIDIGAESSRPPLYGEAIELTVDEECARLLPVVQTLRRHTAAPVSVDTVKAEVARRALDAGADIVNDISAFEHDGEAMAVVAAEAAAPAILMHKRGTSRTMQQNTHYEDLVGEVRDYLAGRVRWAAARGITQVAVDPGLGFGKSVAGNLELLRQAGSFAVAGAPVLIGASRKSFLWKPYGLSPEQALEGSLAAAVLAVDRGVRALRVHDVAATLRAVRVAEAMLAGDLAMAGMGEAHG